MPESPFNKVTIKDMLLTDISSMLHLYKNLSIDLNFKNYVKIITLFLKQIRQNRVTKWKQSRYKIAFTI